jgi:hypothetical protein
MAAPEKLKVCALVVFSPGEYFEPSNFIQSSERTVVYQHFLGYIRCCN